MSKVVQHVLHQQHDFNLMSCSKTIKKEHVIAAQRKYVHLLKTKTVKTGNRKKTNTSSISGGFSFEGKCPDCNKDV